MLYKILHSEQWARAEREGRMPWARVDVADGFVHLSAADQVRGTATKHFAGQPDLVLLSIDADALTPDTLRWEPSRGGALFPHVYGDVPLAAVVRVDPLRWEDGDFVFPELADE